MTNPNGERELESPQRQITVEPWPSGGWAVRVSGHPVPISRHDTEEDAVGRAAAYRRGLERESLRSGADNPQSGVPDGVRR